MTKEKNQSAIYTNALMDLVLEIGYPEYPGRTEDLPAVKKLAKKFGLTPEQVASDVPKRGARFAVTDRCDIIAGAVAFHEKHKAHLRVAFIASGFAQEYSQQGTHLLLLRPVSEQCLFSFGGFHL